jgi:uncharacterized protein YoxC
MEVALTPAAEWSLVIIAAFNLLLFAGLVVAVVVAVLEFKKLRAQIQPIIDRVKPILEEARPVVAGINPMIDQNVKPILENVQDLTQNVKPILGNVQEITHRVSDIVSDIGEHAHEIAETGQHTVKDLTHRVEATGHVVTDTVSKPVIGLAGVFAGIARAFSVLKEYQPARSSDGRSDTVYANGDGTTAGQNNIQNTRS